MKSINTFIFVSMLLWVFSLAGCSHVETTVVITQPVLKKESTLELTPESIISELSPTVGVTEPSTELLALPPADETAARLSVPEGFAIRTFVEGLQGRPRFMTFGPDGSLYVSLIGAGQVVRLPDLNQDGLADNQELVIQGLIQPHGLEWHDGWLYVAENDRITRFRPATINGHFDQRELVTDNIPGGVGHVTRTLHFGPDGKLYVSAGSSCNVCEESDPRRAAILRFNADGSIPADNPFASDSDLRRQPVWAWGLRNSVDFVWTESAQMWVNMNGRDNLLDDNGLPDNLPPEVIVFPVQGAQFFGWPYCYSPVLGYNGGNTPQVLDAQSGLTLPSGVDCGRAVPALYTDLPHSAPLGMDFGQAGNFPVSHQKDLFVAYHGSWNTKNQDAIRDCMVVRIVIQNGQPLRSEDFINGWREPGHTCGDGSAYGRPVDVVFGPDGAMYISDDAGGRVYRVISIR